tara:strand:- start:648 stop:1493 length:846 start_codon:yes stop_codon:yes gene_type:complete
MLDWRSDYLRNFYWRYSARQRPLLERGPSCKADSEELKKMYEDWKLQRGIMTKYIFDVDGTLTPSRQTIEEDFLSYLLAFADNCKMYIVTGSDKEKTIEQLGTELCNKCQRVYNCSGSDVYEQDNNVYRSEWTLPEEVKEFLEQELENSDFPIRTGKHIETRPGGINFSVLGRGENDLDERRMYVEYDHTTNERENISNRLRLRFPYLNVQIGGQTGLDISNVDKSQILRDFNDNDQIHFFGDMMSEGENDYPLAKAVRERGGYTYHVKDHRETFLKLMEL